MKKGEFSRPKYIGVPPVHGTYVLAKARDLATGLLRAPSQTEALDLATVRS
jgi:hypothetical protein